MVNSFIKSILLMKYPKSKPPSLELERFSRILARTEPQSADMQEILKGTLMGDKGEW